MPLEPQDDEPRFWLDELVRDYLDNINHMGKRKSEAECRRFFALVQAVAVCTNPSDLVPTAASIEAFLRDGREPPITVPLAKWARKEEATTDEPATAKP